MPSSGLLNVESDAPVGSFPTSLLHRLRTAALPPKPFPSADSESGFLKRYQEDGMLAYSIALLIGGIALFGFFIAHAIEGTAYGSDRWIPQATRLTVALSLVTLAYLLLSKRSWFFANFDRIGLIGPVVAIVGVALLPFTMFDSATRPGFPFARFFLSLATTIWICFAFSRISRTVIILTSTMASVALTGFAIYHGYEGAYFSSMHLMVAIWAGWALSVLIERRERQTFMSQERMRIESHAMAENIERADLINEMQTEALQTIAHDIRQPLLSLGLYADIMRSKYDDTPSIRELAEQIKACLKASENSIIIVENVLHSAGEASQFNLTEITFVRPLTMLEIVFSPILAPAGVRLNLPDAHAQQIHVWTNEHALNEILSNLIANAGKHAWPKSSDRSKRISVVISRIDDKTAELAISDNGRGINPGDLDRIFEKGYRSPSEQKSPFGNGLGLAIVRGLVARLAGHSISVESSVGVGTTFRLRIPLTDPQSFEG